MKFEIGDRVRVRGYENLGVDGIVVGTREHLSTKRYIYDVELNRSKYSFEESREIHYTEAKSYFGFEIVKLGKIGDVVELDVMGEKINGVIDHMFYNHYFNSWYYGFILDKEYIDEGFCHGIKTRQGGVSSNKWAMYERDFWKKYLDVSKVK